MLVGNVGAKLKILSIICFSFINCNKFEEKYVIKETRVGFSANKHFNVNNAIILSRSNLFNDNYF